MFDHLFKICLSVILVTSLVLPMKWCCADKEQVESETIAANDTCCASQTEQSPAPADQTNDCRCCDVNVFTPAVNTKVDSDKTNLSSNHSQPKTIPSETERTVDSLSPSAQSRPLHLMHCVWIC